MQVGVRSKQTSVSYKLATEVSEVLALSPNFYIREYLESHPHGTKFGLDFSYFEFRCSLSEWRVKEAVHLISIVQLINTSDRLMFLRHYIPLPLLNIQYSRHSILFITLLWVVHLDLKTARKDWLSWFVGRIWRLCGVFSLLFISLQK